MSKTRRGDFDTRNDRESHEKKNQFGGNLYYWIFNNFKATETGPFFILCRYDSFRSNARPIQGFLILSCLSNGLNLSYFSNDNSLWI